MDHRFAHHDEDGDVVATAGFVEACILLALDESSAYGYQLKTTLDDFGLHGLDRGRIYRALRSMEAAGLVISQWDTTTRGPARRNYDLLPAGREALQAQVLSVRRQRRQLSRFLSRFQRVNNAGSEAVA
ncbi:MAG: PadR family transcriptional regulator [Acidimicrobiales bacterium]